MKANNTPATMNEQTKEYFRNVYGTYENLCEQADEYLARLRNELQEYHDNAPNMVQRVSTAPAVKLNEP